MKLDFSEIVPNLYQGGYPGPGSQVAEAGFDILVLSAREYQRSHVYFPGVKVIPAPNNDSPTHFPLTAEDLKIAVRAAFKVAHAVQEGEKVLVTCAAGMNRSGLISALAIHILYGWSGDQCIRVVREKRGPKADGYYPLSNSQFVSVLRKLPSQPGILIRRLFGVDDPSLPSKDRNDLRSIILSPLGSHSSSSDSGLRKHNPSLNYRRI